MISDHFRKPETDTISAGTLWAIAGALVIICQLVAFVMVADGQVKKAELRESQLALQRVAIASCLESSIGAARHSCLQQARASDSYVSAGLPVAGGSSIAKIRSPAIGAMLPTTFASN